MLVDHQRFFTMIVQKQEAPAGQKFKPPVSYVGLIVMTIGGKDSPSFTEHYCFCVDRTHY